MRPKFPYHSILLFRLLQRILFLFLIVFAGKVLQAFYYLCIVITIKSINHEFK